MAAALALPRFGASQSTRTRPISLPPPLPRLDGAFLLTEEILRAAGDDWGHSVGQVPLAVVRPGSIEDLARVVRYANRHGLGVAVRGRGHCAYGQAQVDRGIVIDSSALKGMRWDGRDVTVEAGALWDDVARETLSKRRIPPVMPDMVLLSVGGTLSSGGIGEMSFRSGAQVDQVVSLDVVTGTGELVSCSASRNTEVFQMTLAGMGQCALIGRARLRLAAAPAEIQVARLHYGNVHDLLRDAAALANSDAADTIGAELNRSGAGWKLELLIGQFVRRASEDVPALPFGLKSAPGAPVRMPFSDYLGRRTRSVLAAQGNPQPNPALILTFGSATASAFVAEVLSEPRLSLGIWRIEVLPLVTSRFAAPLHPLPGASLAFTVRLQRRASARNAPDHFEMLKLNEALVRQHVPAGAKVYPPFAPALSPREWQLHYGAAWERFAAAKQRYDPYHVLTPGAAIFNKA